MTEGKAVSCPGHFSLPLRDLGMRLKGSRSDTQASSLNGMGMRGYGCAGRLANETINGGCL